MKQFIGCDSHRRYSVFVSMDERGNKTAPVRIEHEGEALQEYLKTLPSGSDVALEATGSWYWLVDTLESAGLKPRLSQAFAVRRMIANPNKTDGLDAGGLATLLRNGTLPEVWIPDGKTRDLRSMVRSRLALRQYQTGLKNRVVAAVNRYGLRDADDDQDLFAGRGRVRLSVYVGKLPEYTREATIREWEIVDELEDRIEELSDSIKKKIGRIGWSRLLKTMPGVGDILGATIFMEIGDVRRFPSPRHLASYAGLVPTVHSSGGKTHHGPTNAKSNHYLRWAFVEAANVIVGRQKVWRDRHSVKLYMRLRGSKGHSKAAVAVARHLAESSWWILTKAQGYREPQPAAVTMSSSKNG